MRSEPLLAGRRLAGPASARLSVDGRPYINFAGCCYLAMQTLPELRAAGAAVIDCGSPWSRLLNPAYGGIDPLFDAVEEAGADYFGCATSVYLPSGYLAAFAGLAGLRPSFDVIFIDELAHFSLFDAATLAGIEQHRYAHADADALADAMRRHLRGSARPAVLTDGVFATSGRVPPLQLYQSLAAAAGGLLFVDESHAYGVLGGHGRGAAEHCGADAAMHAGTLGKGLCAQGGLYPCSLEVAARVRRLPPVRAAGPGAPVSAAVATAALRYAAAQPQRRMRLAELAQRLKRGLRSLGLELIETPAPISSFSLGSHAAMAALQAGLFERGFYVTLSDYIGAGPEGMIRCSSFADHSDGDVDALVAAVAELV